MTWKDRLEADRQALQTVRDELRVQIHLGAAEAKEAWRKLEKDFQHVEAKLEVLRDASQESADDVAAATHLLMREIRDGYERVRSLL